MSQAKIRNALEKRLSLFATTKNLPIVPENKSTIPTTAYLQSRIIPGTTQDPSIGANHRRYQGIYRITYYTFDLNKGMNVIDTLIDELIAHFPRGLQLQKDGLYVHIENTPSNSSVGYESKYAYVSVDMYYRCDVITT